MVNTELEHLRALARSNAVAYKAAADAARVALAGHIAQGILAQYDRLPVDAPGWAANVVLLTDALLKALTTKDEP